MSEGIRAKIPEIIDAKRNLMEASFKIWNLRLEALADKPEKINEILIKGGITEEENNTNCGQGTNCADNCGPVPVIQIP